MKEKKRTNKFIWLEIIIFTVISSLLVYLYLTYSDFLSENIPEIFLYDKKKPMLFNSGAFFLFFSFFIIIYTIFARKKWFIAVYVILFSIFFQSITNIMYWLNESFDD